MTTQTHVDPRGQVQEEARPWSMRPVSALIVVALILAAVLMANVQPIKDSLRRIPGYPLVVVLIDNLSRPIVDPVALGDGGPAGDITLIAPGGLALDAEGNVYISDRIGLIWKIDPAGTARVIAGTGRRGRSETGGDALTTNLGAPEGLALDAQNRLYFADSINSVVLRIAADGRLEHIAGDGHFGFSGDGGLAIDASFDRPFDIGFDAAGNLYVVDVGNNRIRRIDQQGKITTVAGNGESGYSGDGGPAVAASLRMPYGAYVDSAGDLYVADSGNHVVRKVDEQGTIRTVAGTGKPGYAGDGGPAISAQLDSPQFLISDESGTLYVGDEHNNAIRAIAPDGTISTVVGDFLATTPSDGTARKASLLKDPEAMLFRDDGALLIVDGDNSVVRLVRPDGKIELLAGQLAPPEENQAERALPELGR